MSIAQRRQLNYYEKFDKKAAYLVGGFLCGRTNGKE